MTATQFTELTRSPFLKCIAGVGIYFLAAAAMSRIPARLSVAEQELLTFEDQLFAADVQHDAATIQRGFANEAIFVHANGSMQTKSEYIQAMQSHNFESVVGVSRVVKIFGNVGIVRGAKNLVLTNGMQLSGSYLTVYIMRDGRWQMLDEQSAPAMKPVDMK